MAKFEIRILVDQGSSTNIIYFELLQVFRIEEKDLTPYRSSNLSGFNCSKTKPLGYFDRMITFGEESVVKTVNT